MALPASFGEVQVKFSSLYTAVLSKYDLSLPQYAVLNMLENAGSITMTEMSRRLHISKPAVTHLVDRLEAGGFVKRGTDSGDRRVYRLEIKPRGKKIAAAIRSVVLERTLVRAFRDFSPAERGHIEKFFERLTRYLDQVL